MAEIKPYIVNKFKGFASKPEPQSVAEGVVIDGLNWMFQGGQGGIADKIELRRGYKILGTDAGNGKVTGIRKGIRQDGTEVLFKTYGRKIFYFDDASGDWIEIGLNALPADADGEDVAIEPYTSLSGYSIFLSSPNSSIYKIMLANPSSLIDMLSTNYRGKIKVKNGRMLLWNRKSSDKSKDDTGIYGSKLDKDSYSDYTTVSAEAIGSSGATNYSGTLAFKAAGSKRNCFGVRITDGTRTVFDDFNGAFVGDGTGTINYATGAYSITFNTLTTGAVTATYFYEDPTSGGICDFGFSATRLPGEGFSLRQDDGGGIMQNVAHLNGDYYCVHERKSWKLSISTNDATASNLPYRELLGTSNWRGVVESDDGIFVINTSYESASDVIATKISIEPISSSVIPKSISDIITFEDYRFDKAVLFNWGGFILIACRTSDATANNRLFIYDKTLSLWHPPMNYQISCLESYNGALVAGDSVTNNVYELFSGNDDDDFNIRDNYATFNITKLGVAGLKKMRRIICEGEIQESQTLEIWASFDRGEFILLDTIYGNGSYVDIGSDILVGQSVLGSKVIGGSSTIVANHYKKDVKINSSTFEDVSFKVVATGIGYVSVSMYGAKDIRYKGEKSLRRYRA